MKEGNASHGFGDLTLGPILFGMFSVAGVTDPSENFRDEGKGVEGRGCGSPPKKVLVNMLLGAASGESLRHVLGAG